MDVQMPVTDCPTAVAILRCEERSSNRARSPILALTSNVMRHQLDSDRATGMDGHVGKPNDVVELFEALTPVLDGTVTSQVDVELRQPAGVSPNEHPLLSVD